MGDRPLHPIYEFGDFQLDAVQRLFRSRVDGCVVQLNPRVFETLLYLVEHAGQLIEKSTLMKAIWPNVIVEEGNLTQAIHELRRALKERPGEHRFIVTVPGRGYSFVADVVLRERAPQRPGFAEQRLDAANQTTVAAGPAAPPPIAASLGQTTSGRSLESSGTGGRVLPRLQGWLGGHSRPALWLSVAALVVAVGMYAVWEGFGTRIADRSLRPATEQAPLASIAVLAFTDLSPAHDQQYFSDGLAEDMMHLLAQAPSLRVIARTSSFSFKDKNVDVATIADKLGVSHVLEGSVRRAGNHVRISVQLIDAATSSHVWSEIYDRKSDDIFAIQGEIATSIASVLKATLTGAKGPATAAAATDPQAYEQYLRAHFFFYRRQSGDIKRAEDAYRRALEIDPTYARAWAGLAGVYLVEAGETHELGLSRDIALAQVRDAAERALTLAPDLAEAHVRLANHRFNTGDRAGAREQIQRAGSLEPDSPLVLGNVASIALIEGRLEEAIELTRRAVVLDPLALVFRSNLGMFLFYAESLGEARTELQRVLELAGSSAPASDPRTAQVAHDIALILIAEHRLDEALALIRSWPDGAYRDHCLALIHDTRGNRSEADQALQRMIAVAEPHWVAEIYAHRGEVDETFRWLAKAAERSRENHDWGQFWRYDIRYSPFASPLHRDPRWKAWLAEAY